jgi:hypothetical protein
MIRPAISCYVNNVIFYHSYYSAFVNVVTDKRTKNSSARMCMRCFKGLDNQFGRGIGIKRIRTVQRMWKMGRRNDVAGYEVAN